MNGELEKRLMEPCSATPEAPLGLYVHIPFCAKRCAFCYYLSYANPTRDQVDAYIEALISELAAYARKPALRGRRLDFVYFGGGTPSLLSVRRLNRLFHGLKESFPWDHVREVTFECAPQSLTRAKARELREAGVTRISLGAQQLDDDVLRANGRVHLVSDVRRAYAAAREPGFELVNLDLMVGMVGETAASLAASLESTLELEPDSLTVYQLEIPFSTPLAAAIDDLKATVASWNVKQQRQAWVFARLEKAGYELRSAYTAVRDSRCEDFIYQNAQYHGADLLGIGVSSFSYLDGVHQQNIAALKPYLECVESDALPLGRSYALTPDEQLVREVVLQFKLGRLKAEYFSDKFGVDIAQRFAEPLTELQKRGWLTLGPDGVTVTRDGLVRVDRWLPFFYLPEHRGARYS